MCTVVICQLEELLFDSYCGFLNVRTVPCQMNNTEVVNKNHDLALVLYGSKQVSS